MKKALFLRTHNSTRSQMAEGLLRHLARDTYQVFSAGTEKTFVRPQAIPVMAEIGIDISKQESKTLEQYLQDGFDEVITVCDDANEAYPVFPNAKTGGTGVSLIPQKRKALRMSNYRSIEQSAMRFSRR